MHRIRLAKLLVSPAPLVPAATLALQAFRRMRELGVGALSVVDELGHPVGLLLERHVLDLATSADRASATVAQVMGKVFITVPATMEALDACGKAAESPSGCVVVTGESGRLAGIVCEPDLAAALDLLGRVQMLEVAAAMKPSLATLPEDATVTDAVRLMAKVQLDCVVVEKHGQALGFFSQRDLLRVLDLGENGLAMRLGDVKSPCAGEIDRHAPLAEALNRMDKLSAHRLLVTDKRGQFVGVLSHRDIAALACRHRPGSIRRPVAQAKPRLARHRRPALFALVTFMAALAGEQVIEHFVRQRALEQEKIEVLQTLSTLRTRLEGVINANLFLVHGLSAVIATRPDMDQEGFAAIARRLVDGRHALRNIAAAPDLVVSLMYPMQGNEAALGLDYRTHPTQREAALRARTSGTTVLAGPVGLVQGGIGLIEQEPVFLPPAHPSGEPRFWGLVSAVLDAETVYLKGGLRDASLGVRLAVGGRAGGGPPGPVFLGAPAVLAVRPVTMVVSLPGGTWQMAAIPAEGWGQGHRGVLALRLVGLLLAAAAALFAYRLVLARSTLADTAQRLKESQDLFDRFMTNLPLGAYVRNPDDGSLPFSNHWLDGRLPAASEHALAEGDRQAATEGYSRHEETLVTAQGQPARWEVQRFIIPRAGDRPLVGGVISDVTARYQADNALRASEQRYRHLFEHNPLPMVVYERGNRRILAVNEAFLGHYGYSLEEVRVMGFDDLLPEAERARFAETDGQLAGLAAVGEWHHRKKDGQFITVDARCHDMEYEGRMARIVVLADTTSRVQAEEALREQEEFFRLIAENMVDLVAVLDLEGQRIYNSPSYSLLFGDPDALKGTDSFEAIHPDDRETVRAAFRDTVRTGRGQRGHFRFVLPDGSERTMESQGGVIRDASGKVARVVVVSRDVTEHKRMEEEIRQLNSDLEERVRQRTAELAAANKELETFTYSVSHDLKAPLRGIDGYSRLLLEDHGAQLDDEGRLFLNNVRTGVEQMGQLIEDLLAYSRMERRDMTGYAISLDQQVRAILAERRADIEARGMEVDADLPPVTVRADQNGLAMVLRNLVDNALKFTRDSQPPRLSFHVEMQPASLVLAVADNGIGFDMQFHDRIFEIFHRLQRAEDYPGTGIGLAIVRKAMQRMDGRIWARSAPGQGATFYLEIPR